MNTRKVVLHTINLDDQSIVFSSITFVVLSITITMQCNGMIISTFLFIDKKVLFFFVPHSCGPVETMVLENVAVSLIINILCLLDQNTFYKK